MKSCLFVSFFALCLSQPATSQQSTPPESPAAYKQVATERAQKIVATLAITDSAAFKNTREIIARQYIDLKQIHDARDKKIAAAKAKPGASAQQEEETVKKIETQANKQQDKLHKKYLAKLSSTLSPAQVDEVKDGMTYGALPKTYTNYLAMIPNLTEEQKSQLKTWLTEAREHAMDAGSAKEKLGWFGKYKGKITNYLTAANYDLKKLEADWLSQTKNPTNPAAGNPESATRAKILLDSLALTDGAKKSRVQILLTQHLDSLNAIFQRRKSAMQAAAKSTDKELANARSEAAWSAANGKLNKLHAVFLGKLSTELSANEIEKLKDVMTEGGRRKEYKKYLALFPNLQAVHKTQVWTYLTEARENALDAESADVRKQWFIKYRGRANNFLAAAGYDLRKATDELEKRQIKK